MPRQMRAGMYVTQRVWFNVTVACTAKSCQACCQTTCISLLVPLTAPWVYSTWGVHCSHQMHHPVLPLPVPPLTAQKVLGTNFCMVSRWLQTRSACHIAGAAADRFQWHFVQSTTVKLHPSPVTFTSTAPTSHQSSAAACCCHPLTTQNCWCPCRLS